MRDPRSASARSLFMRSDRAARAPRPGPSASSPRRSAPPCSAALREPGERAGRGQLDEPGDPGLRERLHAAVPPYRRRDLTDEQVEERRCRTSPRCRRGSSRAARRVGGRERGRERGAARSTAGAMYAVWNAPATWSGITRAPAGGSARSASSAASAPAATIWPPPLRLAGVSSSDVEARDHGGLVAADRRRSCRSASRRPPPPSPGRASATRRMPSVSRQHAGDDGRGDLADRVAGDARSRGALAGPPRRRCRPRRSAAARRRVSRMVSASAVVPSDDEVEPGGLAERRRGARAHPVQLEPGREEPGGLGALTGATTTITGPVCQIARRTVADPSQRIAAIVVRVLNEAVPRSARKPRSADRSSAAAAGLHRLADRAEDERGVQHERVARAGRHPSR